MQVTSDEGALGSSAEQRGSGTLDQSLVTRFAANLAALISNEDRVGIAVSGGPDSLALLLLAAHTAPDRFEAATVDHGLRHDSGEEALRVAEICAELGIRHEVLTANWDAPPTSNLQAQARAVRYDLLERWAVARNLAAVATAHHADDQAETLLMRLARGAGLAGLASARASRLLGGHNVRLIRPLLAWRHSELQAICNRSGIVPVDDPANSDPRHDRTIIREWLNHAPALIDPVRVASSAQNLADAEDALDWVLQGIVAERLIQEEDSLLLRCGDLPRELQRRLLLTAFERAGKEAPRGPDLVRAMNALHSGRAATLAGLKLEPGDSWRIRTARPRRA